MPIQVEELKSPQIIALVKAGKPGRYAVGGDAPGLYLRIEGKSAAWVLRAKIGKDGRRVEIGLGPYVPSRPIDLPKENPPKEPFDKTLAEAREWSRIKRSQLRSGDDLVAAKRAAKKAEAAIVNAPKPPTFGECAEVTITNRTATLKNKKARDQWENTLKTYCAKLWDTPIASIDHVQVADTLKPIWTTKHETARRVRMRMEAVFDYAISSNYRTDNAAEFKKLQPRLPTIKYKKTKHPALPYRETGAFLEKLRTREGMGAKALEFGILCASRSGEVRGMLWTEVEGLDGEAPVWKIPGSRMKAGNDHSVPLSPQAVAILKKRRDAPRLAGVTHVFPSPNGGALSDMTLTKVLRDMGHVGITVHGFRSCFKDFAANETRWPDEVSEEVLAHTVGSSVRNDYRRGEALAKRRELLREWATYCGEPGSNVVALKVAS